MRRRIASINDLPIKDNERKYRWALDRLPDDHPPVERRPLENSYETWTTAFLRLCPLLALSGHGLLRCKSPLSAQSGHWNCQAGSVRNLGRSSQAVLS